LLLRRLQPHRKCAAATKAKGQKGKRGKRGEANETNSKARAPPGLRSKVRGLVLTARGKKKKIIKFKVHL
jgi:hypothetical protein